MYTHIKIALVRNLQMDDCSSLDHMRIILALPEEPLEEGVAEGVEEGSAD
jgi:hypothetical protein